MAGNNPACFTVDRVQWMELKEKIENLTKQLEERDELQRELLDALRTLDENEKYIAELEGYIRSISVVAEEALK